MGNEPTPLRAVGSNVAAIGQTARKTAEAYSVHISEILKEESTAIEFLVPGCIPRGNIVLLTGESGAKKSWLAYDLARAVASGTGWLGKNMPCPAGPLPVMILNYDNPTETLRTRLKKLGFTTQDHCFIHTLGYTKPYISGAPPLLTLPEQESRLHYLLEYRQPGLIIFDSFRQGVTLDENDSQKMGALMNIFKKWMPINNTTILLIHHTAKSENTKGWKAQARGSGEIVASSDVVLEASLKGESRTEGELKWTKSRTWDVGRTTKLDFDVVDEFKDGVVVPPAEEDDVDPAELREIELVQRVLVRAKTPLPFELELRAVERVVAELAKSDRPYLSPKEVKARIAADPTAKTIVKDDAALKEALKNARLMGLARFVQDGRGRGYQART